MNCPCCGQEVKGERLIFEAGKFFFRGKQTRISRTPSMVAEKLAIEYPRTVSFSSLVEAVYYNRDEPENSEICVYQAITRARKALNEIGVELKNEFGIGYRLELKA